MALPDKIWHFDRIALCAPTRAAALESAESPAELVKAISIALERV